MLMDPLRLYARIVIRQERRFWYAPITPAGYRFTGWSGVVNSSQEAITFQMPFQNTTLCANFEYEGYGGGPGGAVMTAASIMKTCHVFRVLMSIVTGRRSSLILKAEAIA